MWKNFMQENFGLIFRTLVFARAHTKGFVPQHASQKGSYKALEIAFEMVLRIGQKNPSRDVIFLEWVSRGCREGTYKQEHASLESMTHFAQRVPPRVAKTCVVHPVFAQVVGELGAADPRI